MMNFLKEYYLTILIIVLGVVVSVILGRWIYKDSKRFEGSKWKRILLALQGLNSNGLITYLLMRRQNKNQ
jgi:hypothetical protein